MHIALNAVPVHPGGGLTVARGLLQSLRQTRPDWRITVYTAQEATHREVEALSCANQVRRVSVGGGALGRLGWQNTMLGRSLERQRVDALIGFNHYCFNVRCPQVTYHLNLRRFTNAFRSRGPASQTGERIRDCLSRASLTRAEANVFESQFLLSSARRVIREEPKNQQVIYIGMPDELLKLPPRESRPTNSRRLLAITSPAPHKDNHTLIRVLAGLTVARPEEDWRLRIAARTDSPAWRPIRELAEQLRVASRIDWLGFCDQNRLTIELRNALCLVSTSRLESFSMVALESMCRGCPPVVCDCAAMPESIGDSGLLGQPGDATSFVEQVLRLASEDDLAQRLVDRGRDWVQQFRWSTCGEQFAEALEQAFEWRPTKEVGTVQRHASSRRVA